MTERSIGVYQNIKLIDLTGFDGKFFVTISAAEDTVKIIATGRPHQLHLIKARPSRTRRTDLIVTNTSSALGSIGMAISPVPLPRRRGTNIVVRRSNPAIDPKGVDARSPITKRLGVTPVSREGTTGVMIRIEAPKGTVVKY